MESATQKWTTIAVNKKETATRQCGGQSLTYTSWQTAWKMLFSAYPQSKVEVLSRTDVSGNILEYHGNEEVGYSVLVKLVIPEIAYNFTERLAVLDGANKPQKIATYNYKTKKGDKQCVGMTIDDVNNTIQRCTVKNIARAGIGLNVYEGDFSDVRVEENINSQGEQTAVFNYEDLKKELIESATIAEVTLVKNKALKFKGKMTKEQTLEFRNLIQNTITEIENLDAK